MVFCSVCRFFFFFFSFGPSSVEKEKKCAKGRKAREAKTWGNGLSIVQFCEDAVAGCAGAACDGEDDPRREFGAWHHRRGRFLFLSDVLWRKNAGVMIWVAL